MLWLVMFVGWTAYGLLYAYQSVEWHVESGEAYSWQHELRTNLVGMWGWIPLAMFLFWMVERVPIRRGQILRAAAELVAPGGHILIVAHAAPPPWRAQPSPASGWAPMPARIASAARARP